jgi:hypothetical protein
MLFLIVVVIILVGEGIVIYQSNENRNLLEIIKDNKDSNTYIKMVDATKNLFRVNRLLTIIMIMMVVVFTICFGLFVLLMIGSLGGAMYIDAGYPMGLSGIDALTLLCNLVFFISPIVFIVLIIAKYIISKKINRIIKKELES